MPSSRTSHLIGASTAAIIALLAIFGLTGTAGAKSYPVDVRVTTVTGKTLIDQRQYTSDLTVKTSPKASCFGTGTGGSGKSISIGGLTALGVVAQAAQGAPKLRPLLLTDHDFGFPGLGICGIGGPTPAGNFWELKVDGKTSAISGDQASATTITRSSSASALLPQ